MRAVLNSIGDLLCHQRYCKRMVLSFFLRDSPRGKETCIFMKESGAAAVANTLWCRWESLHITIHQKIHWIDRSCVSSNAGGRYCDWIIYTAAAAFLGQNSCNKEAVVHFRTVSQLLSKRHRGGSAFGSMIWSVKKTGKRKKDRLRKYSGVGWWLKMEIFKVDGISLLVNEWKPKRLFDGESASVQETKWIVTTCMPESVPY